MGIIGAVHGNLVDGVVSAERDIDLIIAGISISMVPEKTGRVQGGAK